MRTPGQTGWRGSLGRGGRYREQVMASLESTRPRARSAGEPVSGWAIAAIVFAVMAVLSASAVVVTTLSDRTPGGAPGEVLLDEPSAAPEPGESAAPAEEPEPAVPTGYVAYVTTDGRVLLGTGAEEPVELAADAAVGTAQLGAVAVAPTSDLVAYVRRDGALVVLPTGGGQPVVLATDVALEALGRGPMLAWDPTGSQIAYLAEGTEDMARPRPEDPPPLTQEGVFRVPLPEGVVGDVVKVVDRTGAPLTHIGDPTTRSMVGVVSSMSDDLLILESVAPDTGRPYTLALGTSGSSEEIPTLLSADDPAFAPDGNFVVAVGPDKGGQELIRIETDELSRATLVSADRICNPSISPDSTRIAYGTGEDCSQLHLISARGGAPVDVTPESGPGERSFEFGELGWTPEGRFITFADCRSTEGPVRCGGRVSFLDPDRRTLVEGPEASTVAPVRQPLLQDLRLDVAMDGPIEYLGSFPIDLEAEGDVREIAEGAGRAELELVDGERSIRLELQVEEGIRFATGRLTLVDPEHGIDRTFMVLGSPSVIGIRVVSLSGTWIDTTDLPIASGKFRLAVRRR